MVIVKEHALKNLRRFFLVSGFSFLSVGFSQEPPATSAQQALEQLRMLQKRISTQKPGQPITATATAPGTQVTAEQTTTTVATSSAEPGSAQVNQTTVTKTTDATDEEETVNDLAFRDVTKQLFPLSTKQIVKLKKLYHQNELAQVTSPEAPPKPIATSQFVNLSPGSTPPVIRLSQGFVSSLVFLDSTGSPWPITAYDLGDPTAFNIQWDKAGNTLMIQATKLYTYGNLAVRLHGLNTPVMLTLIPGQKAVDYRVDLRIQGIGPNAKTMPLEEGIPQAASDLLLHVLEGVPPDGSTRLTVSGGDARAWVLNERMYVRTNLTLLSPGWIGSMTSADGMHAYEMQKAPVLLVSWHGKVMQLKVEGL